VSSWHLWAKLRIDGQQLLWLMSCWILLSASEHGTLTLPCWLIWRNRRLDVSFKIYCPRELFLTYLCRNGTCSGLCRPGYYCPKGSTTDTQRICPPGYFGAEAGLKTEQCSPSCEVTTVDADDAPLYCEARICLPGYVCPAGSIQPNQTNCGGAEYYCPAGTVAPVPVARGYYTVGSLSAKGAQVIEDQLIRSAQQQCEYGFYCVQGVRNPCPSGTFGTVLGLSSSNCSGLCAAGYICGVASVSAKAACGNSSVYCPLGSAAPVSFYMLVVGYHDIVNYRR
jgi:hypothetical protein